MNQVFGRSAALAEKIYDIQLLIPEWKVLFALNGEMNNEEIASFLEIDLKEVNGALDRLRDLGLVKTSDNGDSTEVEAPKDEITEDLFLEDEESEKAEPEIASDDALLNEVLEELDSEPESDENEIEELSFSDEESKEELKFEEEADITEETTFEELVEEAAEEKEKEAPEVVEEESSEEGQTETEDGDLDSLINDLLKEDSDSDDDFSNELLSMPETEAPAKPEESEDTETEVSEEESDDNFDLSNIFQSDLDETEQSLEEVLDDFESDTEAESEDEAAVDQGAVIPETGAKKTVLVVDDSVVIRKMVEIALENENFNIVSVANGKDALSFLDKEHVDIVILDIMLPDINGLDILKTIKSNKDLPVIMLSAKDTPRETTRAKELGADDFIPKPFKDEELISKIHEFISS